MRIPTRIAWTAVAVATVALGMTTALSFNAQASPPTPTDAKAAAGGSFPSPQGSVSVSSTIKVSGTYDGGLKRFVGKGSLGGSDQKEAQDPLFEVAKGGVVKNVVIGSPAADGIHCLGSCTIENVWWEDVGEDAATALGQNTTVKVIGGGARKAKDKIFQNNAKNSTFTIDGFYAEDFGKLYRACGNCRKSPQGKRDVILKNVVVKGGKSALVGINSNYGDTATLSNVTVIGDSKKKLKICVRYEGNNSGKEPKQLGTGPGGGCNYSASDINYR